MWLYPVYLIVGFVGMEFFSWFFHRYVMHGPLWVIHKTHHQHRHGFWEWNDVFTLLFGGTATVLIVTGAAHLSPGFWIGMGIALYGAVYFVLHDVVIHNRLKKARRPKHPYLQRLVRAHKVHHKSTKRMPSRAFGLLWVKDSVFRS